MKRVVCINTVNLLCGMNEKRLTIGKSYQVTGIGYGVVCVIDDGGIIRAYNESRFIDVREQREQKLQRILKYDL